MDNEQGLIIYNTPDGRSKVALMARDGMVWLNQQSIAEPFGTSKQNVSWHISNILKDGELEQNSVVKDYLTTADDGKTYHVMFYSLPMILAIGYKVNGKSVHDEGAAEFIATSAGKVVRSTNTLFTRNQALSHQSAA